MNEQEGDRPIKIHERLEIVYDRLDSMTAPTSAQEAFDRLNTVLEQVEDEYSGVPKNPNPGLKFDGRMYPPREDFTEYTSDGRIIAATKGNTIEAQADGTLTVSSRRTGEPVYHREGAGNTQKNESEMQLKNPDLHKAFEAVHTARHGTTRPQPRSQSQEAPGGQHRQDPRRASDRSPER